MKKENIDKIKIIMARIFDVPFESIPNDATLKWFPNWNSLNHVSLLIAIEDEYGLPFINEETIREMTSVEAIADYIENLLAKRENLE